jgi:predicted translation initiation factor SUI1
VTWRFDLGETLMGRRKHKSILFLCTGNYYRSRFAEILFNAVATRMGLPWTASSRGLALERGVNNVGPMELSAIKALETMGYRPIDDFGRYPLQATAEDFDKADFIVALKQAEHLPLLQERFPSWIEKVEFWHVDDAPEVLGLIEREVMGLTARLIGGGKRQDRPTVPAVTKEQPPPVTSKSPAAVVRVGRETKGRRGKGVTIVTDVPLDETGLHDLAAKLKQSCGTGGTVKDGRVEIQGDQRERLVVELERMGYRVKRVGG